MVGAQDRMGGAWCVGVAMDMDISNGNAQLEVSLEGEGEVLVDIQGAEDGLTHSIHLVSKMHLVKWDMEIGGGEVVMDIQGIEGILENLVNGKSFLGRDKPRGRGSRHLVRVGSL